MENAQPKKKMSRGKKAGIIVGAILALLIAAVLFYGFALDPYRLLAHRQVHPQHPGAAAVLHLCQRHGPPDR